MKKAIIFGCFFLTSLNFGWLQAQDNATLLSHYEKFYRQMQLQNDVGGMINALTHLNVLSPSVERRDTLAYIYMNSEQHVQAISILGLNSSAADSDVALSARAISLKNLGDNQRALNAFQLLFDNNQSPFTAYEVADLKILTGNTQAAMEDVEFGLSNATDEMNYAFFERQQPYQVPLKAAFMHLKALITFNGDNENIDEAVAIFDEAIKMAPNFNLASLSRGALLERKEQNQAQ